ncbi:MAG: hypothetical protein IT440_06675, partial [Phycisphaeraceae bacterium]|nr:hypothetical protein [Phycisphaeraceae bacterium]
ALFHQGEERDYALRLLDAGYVIRLGKADPIHHHESPKRDTTRMSLYGRRNDVLFVWHNAPWPRLLIDLPSTVIGGAWYGLRTGRLWLMLCGSWMGLTAIFRQWTLRRPVSRAAYALHHKLRHERWTWEQFQQQAAAAGLKLHADGLSSARQA